MIKKIQIADGISRQNGVFSSIKNNVSKSKMTDANGRLAFYPLPKVEGIF